MSEPIDPSRFGAASTGVLALGALVALFGAPLMKFADPIYLLYFALGLSVAILMILAGQVKESIKLSLIGSLIGCLILVFGGGTITNMAMKQSAANDARCLYIQNDMLSNDPKIENGADIFQALSCRPQGEEKIKTKSNKLPFSLEEAKGLNNTVSVN